MTNTSLVFLFLCSHVCKLVYNGFAFVPREGEQDEETCEFLTVLYNVGGLFLALNSSASILVYFFVGGKFRAALADMVGVGRGRFSCLMGIGGNEGGGGGAGRGGGGRTEAPQRVAVVSMDSQATNRPSTPDGDGDHGRAKTVQQRQSKREG